MDRCKLLAILLLAGMGWHVMMARADQVDDWLQQLQSRDAPMRWEAVRALRALQDTRLVEPLLLLLQSREDDLRLAVMSVLRPLTDSRAVFPLLQVLKEDSNAQVRAEAAELLGRIGDPLAIPPCTPPLRPRRHLCRKAGRVTHLPSAAWSCSVQNTPSGCGASRRTEKQSS
jgi:HEAT repeat protein